ncbi:MAG: YcxB family protein [Phycisphaerales bacterium]|nr:YcxB family protein [Phycisphaerales bacterium]
MVIVADDGSLTVSYDVTHADLEASVARHIRSSAGRATPREATVLLLLVALLVGVFIYSASSPGPVRWVVLTGYGLIAAWMLWKSLRLTHIPVSRVVDQLLANCDQEVLFGTEYITISADGVQSEHGPCTVSYLWSGVKSIEVLEDAIFVSTNSTTTFRIPRRAFASDSEMEQFLQQARSWHRAATDAAC